MKVKSKPKQKAPVTKPVRVRLNRQQQLAKLLGRKSGATIAQMQRAFGWQPHTARAAISGLRKTGVLIERAETDKGSVYRTIAEV